MAGESSVSFKVFLLPDDNESGQSPEVRRFGIDRDVVCSFTYLQQKLQTIFPVLQGRPFKITWRDNDGDNIVISSDEELIIALTEMQADVRKLYVKLVSSSIDSIPAAKIDVIHYGVTCDNCNTQNIRGFRYKCTECQDYDLCAVCEAKGTHSQHNMIRMAEQKPLDINLYYSKWMKKLGKRNRGLGTFCENYLADWENQSRCPYAAGKHDDHHGKKKRKSDKHESSPDSDECHENWEDRHQHGKKSKRHHSHRNYYDWLYYGSPFWPSNSSGEKKDETKAPTGESAHIKYLRTIGKTVADLLDPLGIDVDVEIRSKDDKKKKEAEAKNERASKPDEASTSKDENKKPEKEVRFSENPKPSTSKETAGSVEQITEDLAKQKMSDVPEVDDFLWVPQKNGSNYKEVTLTATPAQNEVNNNAATAAAAAATAPSAPAPPAPTQPNQPGFIYPTLPQLPSQHPNPLVAQALDRMLSMGFTNDGGWLTQLLEAKNGDIYKALDVLQPVKK